ncbi:MAG: hypothetical protein ACI8W8_002460 [Rhodothermales bacterium]|jgi:hypothetical protein
MHFRPLLLSLLLLASLSLHAQVSLTASENAIRVELDGELYCEYVFKGQMRPILYPIIGPHGTPMTRNYPMKEGKDEAKDHPHHTSLFYAHGIVNGADFWHDKANAIEQVSITHEVVDGVGIIRSSNRWLAKGNEACSDETVLRLGTEGDARFIDYQITIIASAGDLHLGDTKEGTMAIRTNPELRLAGKVAKGKAKNSAGDTGKSLWGKSAAWVDYYGPIDNKVVGIAIFDHPSNPRHPTTWHARDYGLICANPFGLSYFQKKPKGSGDMNLVAGEKVTFRYRFLFHPGDTEAAGIEKRFAAWSK